MLLTTEIEWNAENTKIVCELFAEQVEIGNRPNTHLNSVGYAEVAKRFKECIGIELQKKTQIKNKWDKLKSQYSVWNKLLLRQTGKGWDQEKGTIKMDLEWWKKMKVEILGSWPFRNKCLQSEDLLTRMFRTINNDGEDHWAPIGNAPLIRPSKGMDTNNIDGQEMEGEEGDKDYIEEVSHATAASGKRPTSATPNTGKKQKIEITLVIQQEIKRIVDSASSVTTSKVGTASVKEVMDLVLACGADYSSNEHYIDTSLFVKSEQREMFVTLPTPEIRFQWLRKKYMDKYGN